MNSDVLHTSDRQARRRDPGSRWPEAGKARR